MIATEATPDHAPRPAVTPCGSKLLVRFIKPAEKTEAGIWLPETAQRNVSEAEVVAVGPGRWSEPNDGPLGDWYFRFIPWPQAGDVVLLREHTGQCVGEDDAYVDAEEVLGVISGDVLIPLSDWILLTPESRPDVSRGGVHLSDNVQRWRQKGRVEAYGPGALILEEGCAVKRLTVKEALQWPVGYSLVGADVYWERGAEVLQVGRERVEAWLVRATSVIGYDETTLVAVGA